MAVPTDRGRLVKRSMVKKGRNVGGKKKAVKYKFSE
jgi:hypothetical protein